MKPINEMNLTECISGLRNETKGDVWNMGQREIIELTDRIHELTRWIPVEERLPTEGNDGYWVLAITKRGVHKRLHPSRVRAFYFTHWRRIDRPEGV
jgi:hypothetical protein